ANPPGGVRGELVATAVFEFVNGLHQADVAFLDEIQELQAAVGVLLGDGNNQAQVGLDHFFLGPTGLGLANGYAAVDFFDINNIQIHFNLNVMNALLQTDDFVQALSNGCGIGLLAFGDLGSPVQVYFVARELLDEVDRKSVV